MSNSTSNSTSNHTSPGGPLRIMIVDDEAPAREGLALRLRREQNVVVLGAFGNPQQALDAMASDRPDLLLLDIQMPGMNGLTVCEKAMALGVRQIVFVTAYDEHAVRAFELRALDYLLKPVEQERLHEAIERARERMDQERSGEIASRLRQLVADVGLTGTTAALPVDTATNVQRIPTRVDGAIRFVEIRDIDYIDAAGDVVRLHVGKATHEIRKSMGEMIALLPPERFLRIHRSTIVNVERVLELQPYFHGEYIVVLRDGSRLKLSRGYREQAGKLLGI